MEKEILKKWRIGTLDEAFAEGRSAEVLPNGTVLIGDFEETDAEPLTKGLYMGPDEEY